MLRKLFCLVALLVPPQGFAEPLGVFVSVAPLKTFVEKVGGDLVKVEVMVQPGHSPATYEPTPRQIGALSHTAWFVRIGVPFEQVWMERIRAANPVMRVSDLRTGLDLRIIESHDEAHDPAHGAHRAEAARDPHVWTSPPLVKHMAHAIRDALTTLDSANGPAYARNARAFAAELDRLDADIRHLLEDTGNRRFMVYHPSWGYFADTYGLTQVPIEKEGKEPGARALAALIEQARREQVKVIFVQPQFDRKSASQLARTIGGRVVAIDPLSADYADNLRHVARVIADAMRQ